MILRNIIIEPIWAIFSILIVFIIVLILNWLFKFSQVTWKIFDFVWIIVGILGFLSLVIENGKVSQENDVSRLRENLKIEIQLFENLYNEKISCRLYNKSDYSPPDIDLRQKDRIKYCNWNKEFHSLIEGYKKEPFMLFDPKGLDKIIFETDALNGEIEDLKEDARDLNKLIKNYHKKTKDMNSNLFERINGFFGSIFIAFALGLRLSIATINVVNVKKERNTNN